ncbi:hypothetical protein J7L02_00125 [Candidatus Woesearchaeota archaeon]|nr:hypothetical protein [Candidatus Woesearchaeota archaeon]
MARIVKNKTFSPLIKKLVRKLKQVKDCKIILPDEDVRALKAASFLNKKKVCKALTVKDLNLLLKKQFVSNKAIVEWYYKKRLKKHADLDFEQASVEALQPRYLAAIAVALGLANGFVSGLKQDSKPFLPAVRVIGVSKKWHKASSFFLMEGKRTFLFADCAFQINPNAYELAEIGLQTAENALSLGLHPRIAFLSYSTHGSGKGPVIDKVRNATLIAQRLGKQYVIDGELQADVAVSKEAARHKKGLELIFGDANVLIFPNLESGNIAYKLVERLAGYKATGPVLQGLNKPVSDLSRGCSWQDVVRASVVVASQAFQ